MRRMLRLMISPSAMMLITVTGFLMPVTVIVVIAVVAVVVVVVVV